MVAVLADKLLYPLLVRLARGIADQTIVGSELALNLVREIGVKLGLFRPLHQMHKRLHLLPEMVYSGQAGIAPEIVAGGGQQRGQHGDDHRYALLLGRGERLGDTLRLGGQRRIGRAFQAGDRQRQQQQVEAPRLLVGVPARDERGQVFFQFADVGAVEGEPQVAAAVLVHVAHHLLHHIT